MDAFVAVLLSQPLRLTHLFIGRVFLEQCQMVGRVLRSMLCEEARDCGLRLDFGHLKTVSFERVHNPYEPGVLDNTADFLPLFYLPSVERISAAIDGPMTFWRSATFSPSPATFSWPATHSPSCSSLRSLKLTTMREPLLGQLLSVTDQLQSLEWRWEHEPDHKSRLNTPVIDLTQITTAISHVRDTLEELIISADCDSGHDMHNPELRIQGSLKAITDFDRLRKFTVPFAFLLGFSPDLTKRIEDFLPRSLEFLTLTDDLWPQYEYEWRDYELMSVLESWLETFQVSTPHLCSIGLLLDTDIDYDWEQPIRDEFWELCVRVGIQVEVTKLSGDNIRRAIRT